MTTEKFNGAWRDKSIYQNAKGCFFIQCFKHTKASEDISYDVQVDSLWKPNWQLPLDGIKDVGNPKVFSNLSEEDFNKTFERIK